MDANRKKLLGRMALVGLAGGWLSGCQHPKAEDYAIASVALVSAEGNKPLRLNAAQTAALEKYVQCADSRRSYFSGDERRDPTFTSILEVKYRSVKRGYSYLLLDEKKQLTDVDNAECREGRIAVEKILRQVLK